MAAIMVVQVTQVVVEPTQAEAPTQLKVQAEALVVLETETVLALAQDKV